MTSGSDKWIRPVKDNSAGKVVADPGGNRWEWQSNDETAVQLKKLENADLAIERTDIHPALPGGKAQAAQTAKSVKPKAEPRKPLARRTDAGGGFNPYDNAGKPRRR
jgi:hypothetical protein